MGLDLPKLVEVIIGETFSAVKNYLDVQISDKAISTGSPDNTRFVHQFWSSGEWTNNNKMLQLTPVVKHLPQTPREKYRLITRMSSPWRKVQQLVTRMLPQSRAQGVDWSLVSFLPVLFHHFIWLSLRYSFCLFLVHVIDFPQNGATTSSSAWTPHRSSWRRNSPLPRARMGAE